MSGAGCRRTRRGLGSDEVIRRSDTLAAKDWRAAFIARARSLEYNDIAERLALPGPAGYPEEEDLTLISEVWGGGLLLQIGDLHSMDRDHFPRTYASFWCKMERDIHLAIMSSSRAGSP